MIKINLLPYRERKKKNILKRQLVVLSVCFGLFMLIVFSVHLYTSLSVSNLEKEVKIAKEELGRLNKIVSELNVVKADKQLLEKKIEIINNLEKNRMATVLLLNEMTLRVPPGMVWLTGFKDAGTNLQLDGFAMDNLAVAQFMKNLEQSPYITSVDLNGSGQEIVSNTKVQKFSIRCNLKRG